MKKCNRCFIEKELDFFCKKTISKDGRGNTCFQCVKEYNDNYYLIKKEEILIKQKPKAKEYYNLNKEVSNKRAKEYYDNNREKHNLRTKQYYQDNKEAHYERTLKWVNNNKDRYKELILNNHTRRLKEDVSYKIKFTINSIINSSLKRNKTYKNNRSSFYIGCTIKELTIYIENKFLPEMNWDNYGKIWEIDHIIGCCNFNLILEEEQLKCFHYTNLQPLFKTTKIAKEYGYDNIIGNRNKPKYLYQNII